MAKDLSTAAEKNAITISINIMQLILSIIFLILAVLSWFAVVGFFIWGIPIGSLLISFSIWFFAQWWYKKSIPLNISSWLFVLPILGLFLVLTSNSNFGISHLFFANNLPPSQIPWWGIFLGLIDMLISWALWWIIPIWIVVRFFRQAQRIV